MPREDVSLGLRQCALLNISVCEPTVEATAEGRGFRRAWQRWQQSLSNVHHHYMLPSLCMQDSRLGVTDL